MRGPPEVVLSVLWVGCLGGGSARSFSGPVAGSVHEDLVAGVDQSVEQRLGDDRVREQAVPVLRRPVRGEDQRLAGDRAVADQLVEVVGVHGGVLTHREIIHDQHERLDVFADALPPGAVGMPAGEIGEHSGGFREPHVAAATRDGVPKRLCHMGFPDTHSEGDRLQQLRAVLPCDVRVVAETHPLFGRLLAARSFKRWSGVLMLVVELPDGSPGTIRADATDVFGGGVAEGVAAVLDAAGLRELHRLTQRLFQSRVAGFVDEGEVGSPRP